jgi:2-dehydropantoate 2-reductase
MNDIRNVLIVGLGALGSIYAVKLQQHDPSIVRVLADAHRQERYTREGIIFNGVRYDFNYVLPEQNELKADLVLISTKADALEGALLSITGFVHENTVIICLQNGITSEEQIAAHYGWDRVLHAHFIGQGSTRIGNTVTHGNVARIVFGDAFAPAPSAKVDAVRRFFNKTGIEYEVPEDILFAQWRKFVLNVGINQASAILRADYGVFQRSEKALDVALQLMQEAILIAQKAGIAHPEAILPWCHDYIHGMHPAFKSSMLQDIEAGHKTEVDIFGGAVCALGEKYGVETPYNAMFVKLIRACEEIRTA